MSTSIISEMLDYISLRIIDVQPFPNMDIQQKKDNDIRQKKKLFEPWYLSHRRPAIRHIAPLDGCACAFEK